MVKSCDQILLALTERSALTFNCIWEQNFAVKDEPEYSLVLNFSNFFLNIVYVVLAAQLPFWCRKAHHLEVLVRGRHQSHPIFKSSVSPFNKINVRILANLDPSQRIMQITMVTNVVEALIAVQLLGAQRRDHADQTLISAPIYVDHWSFACPKYCPWLPTVRIQMLRFIACPLLWPPP